MPLLHRAVAAFHRSALPSAQGDSKRKSVHRHRSKVTPNAKVRDGGKVAELRGAIENECEDDRGRDIECRDQTPYGEQERRKHVGSDVSMFWVEVRLRNTAKESPGLGIARFCMGETLGTRRLRDHPQVCGGRERFRLWLLMMHVRSGKGGAGRLLLP